MLKKIIFIGAVLSICLPQVQAKNYYKWVDSKGNVTYSSKPPPSGAKQQKIETLRSLGTPPAPKRVSPYEMPRYTSTQVPIQQAYNLPQKAERSAEQQRLMAEANKPIPGARGLTASQRNAMAGLSNNTNNSAPPSSITNCDSSGCWGSDGTRYNKGAGNTYFPSTGGSCQNVGGQMQCN